MGQYQRGRRGGRQDQQPDPKPFAFVRLSNGVDRQHPKGHDRYHDRHITGRIHGTIEALSPIHIGSGIVDLGRDVELIKTAVRTNGNVIIPGSSLKGAIRSVVEAISASCVSKTVRRVRDTFPRNFRYFTECRRRRRERLCIACRMFGAMGFQGNVAIQDASYIDGQIVTKYIPALHRPRRYRTDNRNVPMRKFYMHGEVASGETPIEACEVGSKFRFVVQIDNLTLAEWGLLFTALGHHHDHPFKLKIGGAKPICFGSIDFQVDRVHVDQQTRDQYLNWDVESKSEKTDTQLEEWKRQCITQATNSLIQTDLLMELAKILKYPYDRNCPSGLY